MPSRPFPVSDHCDGRRFFNPYDKANRTPRDLLRWWRTRQAVPWPARIPLEPHAAPPAVIADGQVAATFIGHATFLIRTSAAVILTDPVFTSHAGPFGRLGPRRVRIPAISLDALPRVDLVLVTHNHYDHLQPSSLRALCDASDPVFVATLGLGPLLRGIGLEKVVELDWWERTRLPELGEVMSVPAQHFSSRTPFDRNRTLWGGFVVRSGHVTLYFVGDSGYSQQFQDIGRRVPDIDLALIPVGAYEPRWFMKPFHVNPAEAVRIHKDVVARMSLAMHFGTFRLTDEGIDDPVHALGRARDEARIGVDTFRVLDHGESVTVSRVAG